MSHFPGSFLRATAAIALLALLCSLPSSGATRASGEAVYIKYCAGCHDQTNLRVPHHDVLKQMTAARILRTLDFGLMMGIAYPTSRSERRPSPIIWEGRVPNRDFPPKPSAPIGHSSQEKPWETGMDGAQPGKHALSGCRTSSTHDKPGSTTQVEMGLWLFR